MAEEQATPATGAMTVSEAASAFEGLLSQEATESEKPEAEAPEQEVEATEEPEAEAQPEESEGETEETEEAAEAEAETEEQEVPEPKRWKVKAAGEELEVTEDELVKGYQREADYRKKTAEVAERNRQLEAERQHNEQILQTLIPVLQAQVQDKFANVDWVQLASDDPSQYVAMKAEYDKHVQNITAAYQEQQRIAAENQRAQAENHRKQLENEYKRLVERIPDFADPEKGKAIRGELKTYLTNTGYSDEEIGGLSDSRAAEIAYKAMLYDKAQKAKVQSAEKVKNLPKVQKPGNAVKVDPKRAAVVEAKNRAMKSGKVDDLAEFFHRAGFGNSN